MQGSDSMRMTSFWLIICFCNNASHMIGTHSIHSVSLRNMLTSPSQHPPFAFRACSPRSMHNVPRSCSPRPRSHYLNAFDHFGFVRSYATTVLSELVVISRVISHVISLVIARGTESGESVPEDASSEERRASATRWRGRRERGPLGHSASRRP